MMATTGSYSDEHRHYKRRMRRRNGQAVYESFITVAFILSLILSDCVCTCLLIGPFPSRVPMNCRSSTFILDANPLNEMPPSKAASTKNEINKEDVVDVDIETYLASIELELESSSPTQTFQCKIRPPNRYPMIRTLLGISGKAAFDQLLRTTRKNFEFQRMAIFTETQLLPLLLSRQKEELLSKDDQEVITNLIRTIKTILVQPTDKGLAPFRRLGTGRRYKGNVLAMLQDLAPGLVSSYMDAISPSCDHQVLRAVISQQAENCTLDQNRIDAAFKCLDHAALIEENWSHPDLPSDFSNGTGDKDENANKNGRGSTSSPHTSTVNGKECERACIAYLQKKCDGTEKMILQNVYVNHKDTVSKKKYSHSQRTIVSNDGNIDQTHKSSNTRKRQNNKTNPSSGIIWTDIGRERTCSEFDAVLVCNATNQVKQIWEAKYSLGPSTLYDAITKKLSAFRTIVNQDENAILQCTEIENECYYSMKRCKAEMGGDDNYSNTDDPNDNVITFGIFGMDLLQPANAVDQMKAVAVSYLLSNDVDVVLSAVEEGFVNLQVPQVSHYVDLVRKELSEAKGCRVIVKVASEGFQ